MDRIKVKEVVHDLKEHINDLVNKISNEKKKVIEVI